MFVIREILYAHPVYLKIQSVPRGKHYLGYKTQSVSAVE